MPIATVDPSTGSTLESFTPASEEAVDEALTRAEAAQQEWAARPPEARVEPLRAAATLLRARADDYADLMATEMGKRLSEGRAEAEKCAWVCDYYAERGPGFLADEPVETDAARSYVSYRPLGPILAVMPWNFPFWQVFRFAAPALVAGNAGLLKHASSVPRCALALEALWRDAGLPEGLFQTLLVGGDRVEDLLADRRVRGVSLTGSTAAGRAVGEAAGRHLKPAVLELGGSDPYVVLRDADLARAANACVAGRLQNAGQSCIAAKRWIVVEPVKEAFEALVLQRLQAARWGDPREEGVDLGPMARADLRDELHAQVRASIEAGARLRCGGELPEGPGAYYPPTLLTEVAPGMPAYDEELFGPVAALIAAADEEEALEIAADSDFGLGAAVFTGDAARGERIAREILPAGAAFVNDFVRSDPRLPFGGVKDSGFGRELGREGIRSFVNVKTVYVA